MATALVILRGRETDARSVQMPALQLVALIARVMEFANLHLLALRVRACQSSSALIAAERAVIATRRARSLAWMAFVSARRDSMAASARLPAAATRWAPRHATPQLALATARQDGAPLSVTHVCRAGCPPASAISSALQSRHVMGMVSVELVLSALASLVGLRGIIVVCALHITIL